MEKFSELLEKLNSLKIIQKSMDWAECIPDEIWDQYLKDNFKELKSGINPDTHRWYETTISVIKIYDRMLGIRHISNLFSESSDCEDCYVKIEFFEMREVMAVSYEIIINGVEK